MLGSSMVGHGLKTKTSSPEGSPPPKNSAANALQAVALSGFSDEHSPYPNKEIVNLGEHEISLEFVFLKLLIF